MKKIVFKNKLGYALGDLGNGLTFAMSSSFLLAFYTDVLGITAISAGILFLVARIWDAINDPMMGALTDRMFIRRMKKHPNEKTDKFRPFLLRGSFLVVAAAILMFFAPSGFTSFQKLVWAYVTYIAWGMTYTFINIPYGSLAAVMTQDPAERSSLSVARGLGGMVGNLLPAVVIPMFLTQMVGQENKAYLFAMISMGVLAVISYLGCYFTVEENVRHDIKETQEKFSFAASFKVLKNNRPFIAISLASIAMLTGMMIAQTLTLYFFRDVLNALEYMSLSSVIRLLPMLFLSPILSKLVKKFGMQKTVAYSSLLAAIFYGVLMFLPNNIWIYVGVSFIGMTFMIVPHMLIWGMVSDSIDYNQYLSGQRQEGVIYGSYSFVRKLGQAIAGFLGGAGLTLVAYDSTLVKQAASTIMGIKFLSLGMPAIGMLIAFIAFRFIYNLTPEKQKKIIAAINSEAV